MNKMKIPATLTVLIFLFSGCQQTEKNVVTAEFNVNKLLLSDSPFVSKSGFSVNPPSYWLKTESFNSELQKKVMNHIDNKLLAIYRSDSTNCALIISELPESNFDIIKGLLDKSSFPESHDSIWTKVQSSIFKYKTYDIIQVVSQNSEMVVFKLLTHRLSELYELDYIIPRSKINLNMQSVESSIGSLN
jgi:hypothetical protein